MKDFLAHLRARQMRTLIVTNAHRDGLNLKLQETGLDKLVDDIIVSHDFRLPKEDPQFWHEMQKVEPLIRPRLCWWMIACQCWSLPANTALVTC
ncbi:HAD hydrolase-like protein [Aliamphritea spongicola]|nr:HAD hydrolase-like protein [Aliamphritea spongicola]